MQAVAVPRLEVRDLVRCEEHDDGCDPLAESRIWPTYGLPVAVNCTARASAGVKDPAGTDPKGSRGRAQASERHPTSVDGFHGWSASTQTVNTSATVIADGVGAPRSSVTSRDPTPSRPQRPRAPCTSGERPAGPGPAPGPPTPRAGVRVDYPSLASRAPDLLDPQCSWSIPTRRPATG